MEGDKCLLACLHLLGMLGIYWPCCAVAVESVVPGPGCCNVLPTFHSTVQINGQRINIST